MEQTKRTPEPSAEKAEEGKKEDRRRLREILGVLARHNLAGGMTPEKLRSIVEDLGPTFVKLGQIMSMRRDMLPEAYCRELEKLRAEVRPLAFEEVRGVVETEYGVSLRSVFDVFDETPIGSASIAQVHAARLKNGAPVVVKVQRPGIRDTMARDIALLRRAAGHLGGIGGLGSVVDFRMVLDEMWVVAQQEMDFLIEAQHAEKFRWLNEEIAYVTCPRVERRFTTSRVLVMEYIDGIPIDAHEALEQAGYDRAEIGTKLAENYVKQVLEDAFFHADPHPGNLRVRGGKIVWLDLGMMGRLTEKDQTLLKRAVRAIVENDVGTVKEVLLTIGVHSGRIDHARLYADIDDLLTQYASAGMAEMDLSRMLEEILTLASNHGISMPQGISMLCRGMMTMQGVLADLSPDINIVTIMANHLSAGALQDIDWSQETQSAVRALLSSGRKTLDVPAQLSDLLKMTIKGQTKVNLEVSGSDGPLHVLGGMVNRLILGIVLAALLIASGVICASGIEPAVGGMPVYGLISFSLAAVLGVVLLFKVFHAKK
ncbi:MAG: ABC1 kinase family protein [Acutalibacteraceae bacterium]